MTKGSPSFFRKTPMEKINTKLRKNVVWRIGPFCLEKTFIILRRKIERKIFHSVVKVFFIFLTFPMTRQIVCRTVGVLYVKYVWVPPWLGSQKWRVRFPLAANFYNNLFRYSSTQSYFLLAENGVFDQTKGFMISGLLS